jgi:hypothetical protein
LVRKSFQDRDVDQMIASGKYAAQQLVLA